MTTSDLQGLYPQYLGDDGEYFAEIPWPVTQAPPLLWPTQVAMAVGELFGELPKVIRYA